MTTKDDTTRWINYLPTVVQAYNITKSDSIGLFIKFN